MGLIDTLINHMQNRRQAELAFALSEREDAEAEARRLEALNQRSGFSNEDFARHLESGTLMMPSTPNTPVGMRYPARMVNQFGAQPAASPAERVGMLQRIRDRMARTRENMGGGLKEMFKNARDPFQRYPQLMAEIPGTPPMESEQYQPRQYVDPARPRYY